MVICRRFDGILGHDHSQLLCRGKHGLCLLDRGIKQRGQLLARSAEKVICKGGSFRGICHALETGDDGFKDFLAAHAVELVHRQTQLRKHLLRSLAAVLRVIQLVREGFHAGTHRIDVCTGLGQNIVPFLIGGGGQAELLAHLVDVVTVFGGGIGPGDHRAGERDSFCTNRSNSRAAGLDGVSEKLGEFTARFFTSGLSLAAHELFKVALDAIRRGDDLDICFGNICTVCHYVSPSLVRLARNASKSSADAN